MTDKHTNSFEERNFKTQQDQADFRMQQMLKEKGFVRGASESDLEKYQHIAGSYQKVVIKRLVQTLKTDLFLNFMMFVRYC